MLPVKYTKMLLVRVSVLAPRADAGSGDADTVHDDDDNEESITRRRRRNPVLMLSMTRRPKKTKRWKTMRIKVSIGRWASREVLGSNGSFLALTTYAVTPQDARRSPPELRSPPPILNPGIRRRHLQTAFLVLLRLQGASWG